jgi:uncharacterized protein HemY
MNKPRSGACRGRQGTGQEAQPAPLQNRTWAILQLGRIALLSNRLGDAKKWLEEAAALQPADTDAKVMLAEVLIQRPKCITAKRTRGENDSSECVLPLTRTEPGRVDEE